MNPAAKPITKTLVASPERQIEAAWDWTVVQQVQAGDVAVFDQLILKYRERVYAMVYHMTANREDAADLTQDAFIKAFQSIHRFQGQSAFYTWLYRIALNGALSHIRRNKLRSFFSFDKIQDDPAVEAVISQLTDKKDVQREVFVGELQEKLNEAMMKLSIPHRTVVTLFEIDGLSHEEIGAIMNCSVGTVRSRLHYAKQFLQAELHAYVQ
jgi:RNA polymerase sigma-70 factor (ECF subfamily)